MLHEEFWGEKNRSFFFFFCVVIFFVKKHIQGCEKQAHLFKNIAVPWISFCWRPWFEESFLKKKKKKSAFLKSKNLTDFFWQLPPVVFLFPLLFVIQKQFPVSRFVSSEIYHRHPKKFRVYILSTLLQNSDSNSDASSLGCERLSRPARNGGRWLALGFFSSWSSCWNANFKVIFLSFKNRRYFSQWRFYVYDCGVLWRRWK